jgi:hypothetical protein
MGVIGGAVTFTNGSSYLQLANNPSLKPSGSITLEAWVNPTSVGNWNKIIGLDYRADGTWNSPYLSYALESDSSSNQICFRITHAGSGITASTASSLTLSAWNHVAQHAPPNLPSELLRSPLIHLPASPQDPEPRWPIRRS